MFDPFPYRGGPSPHDLHLPPPGWRPHEYSGDAGYVRGAPALSGPDLPDSPAAQNFFRELKQLTSGAVAPKETTQKLGTEVTQSANVVHIQVRDLNDPVQSIAAALRSAYASFKPSEIVLFVEEYSGTPEERQIAEVEIARRIEAQRNPGIFTAATEYVRDLSRKALRRPTLGPGGQAVADMLAHALKDCDPQIPIRRVDPLKDAPLSLQLEPRHDLAKKIAPILAASSSRELPEQLIRVTKEAMEAEARILKARRQYILDGLTPTLESAGPKTSVVLATSQFQRGMLNGFSTSPLTLTQDHPDPIRSRLPHGVAPEVHTDLFCRYVTEASHGEPITDMHAARATLARFIVFNALDNRRSSFLDRKALPPSKTTRIALETTLANELLHRLEDSSIKTILSNAANPGNVITYSSERDFGSAIQRHLDVFLERTGKAAGRK